jgi:hypothetical protein
MSTLPITPGSFVPSRFLKHQLYAIGLGAAVTAGALVFWRRSMRWVLAKNSTPRLLLFG